MSFSRTLALATIKRDIARGILEGVLQAGHQTISLLVLIEVFVRNSGQSGDWAQAMVFSSSFIGMLLSVFYGPRLKPFGFRKATLVSIPLLCSGVFLGVAAFADSLIGFACLVSLAQAFPALKVPVQTQIYHENFPVRRRATYHGWSLMAAQVSTVLFAYFAGEVLDRDADYWPVLFAIMSVSALLAAYFTKKIPSRPLKRTMTTNPFYSLRWLYKDRLFGYLISVWFMFGFANLWIYPIRIVYLVDQMGLSPLKVTILSSVIVEVARLMFLPVWARIFDRINFILSRMIMNAFFVVGIYMYFHAETLWGIGLASFLHGVGFSGGRLSWGLWVTRMVPKERSGEYMAVHVGMTGLRGLIGPFLGFAMLNYLKPFGNHYQNIAMISSGLFLLSILMLIPVLKYGKARDELSPS